MSPQTAGADYLGSEMDEMAGKTAYIRNLVADQHMRNLRISLYKSHSSTPYPVRLARYLRSNPFPPDRMHCKSKGVTGCHERERVVLVQLELSFRPSKR
jgi:hypothetical protein